MSDVTPLSSSSEDDVFGGKWKQPRRAHWLAISDTGEESSTSDPGSPSAPPQGVSFNDDKDRMIASLTAEIGQWKQSDSVKSEELEAARRNVDQLRIDIALEQHRAVESARELFEEQKKTQQLAKELGSLRNQFQTVSSSIEEKDRMITTHVAEIKQLKLGGAAQAEELTTIRHAFERSRRELITNQERHVAQSAELTAQVEEWKQSDTTKIEKLSAAYRDLEKLRADLSTSVAQIVDAQRCHATELTELTSQLEESRRSNSTKAEDVATAREKIVSLENHLSASSSRIIELEHQDENRTVELSSLREQLAAVSSVGKDRDRAVATLNEQIAKWKQVDGRKAQEIITLRKDLDSLQRDLAASKGQIAEEQRRHATESADLTSTIEKWMGSDAAKAQELISVREQFAQLQQINSTSSSRITALDQQIQTLSATIDSVRAQYEAASSYAEERNRIAANLSTEIEQWKLTDVTRREELTVTRNELDQVQHALSAEIKEWKGSDAAKTKELASLREQFQVVSSCVDDKDRTISNLHAEIVRWKDLDTTKTKQLSTARKDLDQLRVDLATVTDDRLRRTMEAAEQLTSAHEKIEELDSSLSTSSVRIIELERRNETQSMQLNSLGEQLEAMKLRSGDKDRAFAQLNAQIEKWKQSDAGKGEELIALHKELDQLRRDLAVSADQIAKDQRRHAEASAEFTSQIEDWKHSYAIKADELAVTCQRLEQLQGNLSTSSSLVSELQQHCKISSVELASLQEELKVVLSNCDHKDLTITNLSTEIKKWTQLATAKTEELDAAHKDLERFRLDVANGKLHAEELAKELALAGESVEQLSTELDSLRDQFQVISSSVEEKDRIITTQRAEVKEWQVKCTAQSKEFTIARNDLEQLRRSMTLEQQRHAVESEKLTVEVEGWKRTDAAKAEKLGVAHRDLEQLRSDLSASVAQIADAQRRHATESTELTSQLEESKRSNSTKAKDLATAREKIASLESHLSTSSSRIIELEQHDKNQTVELSSLREQLAAMSSVGKDRDRAVAALNEQITKWKQVDGRKAQEITALRKELDSLQRDLAASKGQIAEEQQRHTTESADLTSTIEKWIGSDAAKAQELINVREQFAQLQQVNSTSESRIIELDQQIRTLSTTIDSVHEQYEAALSYGKERDGIVAKLTAEIERWELVDVAKREELSVAHNELDQARRNLSASLTQIEEDQKVHAAETAKLVSKLGEWERSSASKTQELSSAYESIEQLKHTQIASSSHIIELEQRNETQSTQLNSLHKQLEVMRTVTDAEIEKWKQADVGKAEELIALRKELSKLHRDLDASVDQIAKFTSQVEELEHSYNTKADELVATRKQLELRAADSAKELALAHKKVERLSAKLDSLHATLQAASSSIKERDGMITTHVAEIEQLKLKGATQTEELTLVRNDLERSRCELITNEERHVAESTELTARVEEWKQSDAAKSEKLSAAHRDLEQLRSDLSASAAQIVDAQQRHAAESAELISQLEELKRSNSTKAQDLATVREKVASLENHLSTSSSRIIELEQQDKNRTVELTSLREQLTAMSSVGKDRDRAVTTLNEQIAKWKQGDGRKAQEIIALRKKLDSLQRDLAASANQIVEEQQRHATESADLTSKIEKWMGSDAAKAQELINVREQFTQLQQVNSTSESRIIELDQQIRTLSTTIDSVREQYEAASSYGKERDDAVANLTAEIECWKLADVARKEELTVMRNELDLGQHALSTEIEKRKTLDAAKTEELTIAHEELEQLGRELSHSSSRITELEEHDRMLSRELASLRKQFQVISSRANDKDHTISNLNAEIAQWKDSDATKTERLDAACKDLDRLRIDLSAATDDQLRRAAEAADQLASAHEKIKELESNRSMTSSLIIELEQRNETQSAQLDSLRNQLDAITSLSGDRDRAVTALNAQIDHWKLSDASKAEELIMVRKELDKFRSDLAANLERWKSLDATKAEELAIAYEKINQLQLDLSASSSQLTEFQQRFKAQQTELDTLRQQLRDTLTLVKNRDDTIAVLEDQLEEWKEADSTGLTKLRHARAELEEVWRKLLVIPTIKESVPDGNASLVDLVSMVDGWMRTDKERAQSLVAEFANKEKEIDRLKAEHERHSAALKSAQTQLDDVRRFVTSADNYADTVMIQTLQKLNAEVQHSTTIIADFILENFQPHAEATEELDSARTRVSESIGQVLTDWLEQESADELTLYLQIAFQAYLSERLSWIISSWTLDEEHNDFITKIYDRMQIAETQTVSGRWRSLTRAYMTHNSTSDGDKLIGDLVEGLSDIVLVAGCATSVSDAKLKFSSKFKDKVSGIVSLAGRFGRMIGEVVSSDFAVLAAQPLKTFEEDTMEEDVDDDEAPHGTTVGQKVVCSTQLGLTKRMQLESGKKHTLMVMKTKVILESFLEDY